MQAYLYLPVFRAGASARSRGDCAAMLTASVLLRRSACSVCVLVQFGMTMVALGAGAEGRGKGITGNALWPATVIESQVP